MNLNRFIEKLQNKPRIVRIQILIGAVFVCMVFIIWVWAVSLNLSSPPQEASGESTLEQLKGVGEEAFRSLEDFKQEFPLEELEKLEQFKGPEQEEVKPVRLPVEE